MVWAVAKPEAAVEFMVGVVAKPETYGKIVVEPEAVVEFMVQVVTEPETAVQCMVKPS